MTRPRPLLNVDLGEVAGEPEELYSVADVVNVACGGHAGDDASMKHALTQAKLRGARIAAHPSYPDRAGFGRTSMQLAPSAITESVRAQCASLARIAFDVGVTVDRVKPHGALYHDASRDPAIAQAVIRGARRGLATRDLVIVGPPHGALSDHASELGLAYEREGFADRAYLADGTLVPRTAAGSVLHEPALAVAQATSLVDRGTFETLCVHSDTPHALEIARAVRAALLAIEHETFGP